MSERIPIRIDPDIEDLVPGFLANRRKDVLRLDALVAAGAYADIRLLGHSMKGAGGGYGFDRISELGAAIENAALREDGSEVLVHNAALADYLARIDIVPGA